jgi:hypothetical protein
VVNVSIDSLLNYGVHVRLEGSDESTLGGRGYKLDRVGPESWEILLCQTTMRNVQWHSLLGYYAANPFAFWSWLMWVDDSIHGGVCLGPCGFRVGYVGMLINEEEEVHHFASDPASLWQKTVRTQQRAFYTDYISDLCHEKDKPRMQGDLEGSISRLMDFIQNLDSYIPKLHRLNASCALGLKALKVSNHAETSLWQTS